MEALPSTRHMTFKHLIREPIHSFRRSLRIYLRILTDIFFALLLLFLGRFVPHSFQTKDIPDLSGKNAVITGGEAGIGFTISQKLAEKGCKVYIACTKIKRGLAAANDINVGLEKAQAEQSERKDSARARSSSGNTTVTMPVEALALDSSSMESIDTFHAKWVSRGREHIDFLVHTAETKYVGDDDDSANGSETTSEGLGHLYAANFLGPFKLTNLLEKYLAPGARVLFASSYSQYLGGFGSTTSGRGVTATPRLLTDDLFSAVTMIPGRTYADTKMQQVAFARQLQDRWDTVPALKSKNLLTHAFNPGHTHVHDWRDLFPGPGNLLASTMLFFPRLYMGFLAISEGKAAKTALWLATTRDAQVAGPGRGGKYWDRMTKRATFVDVQAQGKLERIWALWERDAGVEWKVDGAARPEEQIGAFVS